MHGWGALDSSIVHRFTDPGMSVPPEERESGARRCSTLPPTALCDRHRRVRIPEWLGLFTDERTLYDVSTCTRLFIHALDVHPDGKLDQPPLLCQSVIS